MNRLIVCPTYLDFLQCLFYIRTRCVPCSRHSPPRLYETILLMLCQVKVAVCSEIRTKHLTQSENHAHFFNIKLVVRKVIARL